MGYAYPIDSKVVTNPNGTIDYDRASSSTQLRGLIKSMITNGVNLTESTNLQVMADEETMNLVVKPGYVIIEGALKHFEDDVKVTLANADTTNPRIDTVVARLNLNEDVRDIVIDILQGTPSEEPVAPELTRTTSYYEVGLADILVEVGTTQISQAVVTDTRLLNSRCGMISAIGEIDTETLFNQLTTDFDNWFESIKGKLGDDVAGGLQMQIDGLADDIDTLQEDVETLEENLTTLESGVASERLLWNISDDIYSEVTDLGIACPNTTTYGAMMSMIYHDDKIYGVSAKSGKGTYIHVYDGTSWTSNVFQTENVAFADIIEFKGDIYVATGTGIYVFLFKINDNYSGTQVFYDTTTEATNRVSLAKTNDTLYLSYLIHGSSSVKDLFISTYDGTNSTKRFITISMEKYTYIYGSFVKNDKMYISYPSGSNPSNKYLLVIDLITKKSWKVPTTLIFERCRVRGDMIYGVGQNSNDPYVFIFNNEDVHRYIFGNYIAIAPLDDKFIALNYDYNFIEFKAYRKATSYAPKGTKIYLTDNSFAISDNLEEIDNGYLVTESGEVKLGIYE